MFTGIIQETGMVEAIHPARGGVALEVRIKLAGRRLRPGDSVAVNGCCLTATGLRTRGASKIARFDLLRETLRRTNLQFVRPGALVNLELPICAGEPFGGHFVSGHIDGLGKILQWAKSGKDWVLEISAPADVMQYVIFKGSIAVDGISLTVAQVKKKSFTLWIIPHTRTLTALRERQIGDLVNLEADLLGKYVEKFVTSRRSV